MDERTWQVMSSFQAFLDEAVHQARQPKQGEGPLVSDVVEAHLGTHFSELPVVRLDVPGHQFVNLDIAMEAVTQAHGGAEVIGVGGGDQRHHQTLGDMLQRHRGFGFTVGAVDRAQHETGMESSREVLTFGIWLFEYNGVSVVAMQRHGNMRYDTGSGLEIIAAAPIAQALIDDVRRLMVERSAYRGQVLSFGMGDETFGRSAGGIQFLERPAVAASDVILPAGALSALERHVAGPARHREKLIAAGQHLKRGLLLYGPPGTGKTHTVSYLLGRLPGVTSVVLAGNALSAIGQATELAQALQPSVVVLEDVDLIATQRSHSHGPQPLLFTLLDAMDGLDRDSDVAFLLTTNRADRLESALSQRPGRVDLAVEIPLPDRAARRGLVELYSRGLAFSEEAKNQVAEMTESMTASFFKELMRRTVLSAAEANSPVNDGLLLQSVGDLLSQGERLTRVLLGGGRAADLHEDDDVDDPGHPSFIRGSTPEYLSP